MQIEIIRPEKKRQEASVRVCAYCRVSTESEMQGRSLENQEEHYRAFIGGHPGWEFAGIYADRGISGSKEKRPGFQQMLDDCRRGAIDRIITKSISRFARNTVTVLKYARELRGLGIGICFEEQGIDTLSSEGEMMLSVYASFAEEELRSMSDNTKWAIRKRYERGEAWGLGQRILGYRKDGSGRLAIVPGEAEVVRRIFAMTIDGMAFAAIAGRLNSEGLKTVRGNAWTVSSVCAILKNEKYLGDLVLQKWFVDSGHRSHVNRGQLPGWYVRDDHPAIVTRGVWEASKEARSEKLAKQNLGEKRGSIYRGKHPLDGMLFCPYCGAPLVHVASKAGWDAWCCRTQRREGKKACRGISVPEKRIPAGEITGPVVVERKDSDGKKGYSYTRKAGYVFGGAGGAGAAEAQGGRVLPRVDGVRGAAPEL